MNNTLLKTVSTALTFVTALSFASCGKMDESWSTETTSSEVQSSIDQDVTTINCAVTMDCRIDNKYLKLFNEELQKDGHKYQLKLKQFSADDNSVYLKNIENELKNGTSDIAFLGFDDGSNSLNSLFNSGVLLELDEVISSDKGKALYEAFPKTWWERVKYNGSIYSIPNPTPLKTDVYAAFNTDYLDDKTIENWDGSIEGIYEIIKNVKWNDEEAPRFQYLITDFEFANMIRCDIQNGLLYDYDTMKIENPLESEKLINYFKVLEQMKNDGFMPKSVPYIANTTYVDEKENLESGKFLVVLSSGEPKEYLLKDNIRIKQIPRCISSMIYASIGISQYTKDLDAVIDFLGILYREEKYGNILLYGKQDVDYKLKDGYVSDMDGTKRPYLYNFFEKLELNLFINTYPVQGEDFVSNRKEAYFSYYENVKMSPFVGFQPDYDKKGIISQDFDDFLDSLTNKTMDETVRKYSAKLKSDGIDEYIKSVREQWATYNK